MPKIQVGALLYVRKSTVELEGRSLEQQEAADRELAARLGLPVVGVVVEEASAYAERVRPKFTAALQRAAAERLVIITWAIDRFSRKGAEAVLPLLKEDSPLRLVTVEGDDTADERQRLIIIIKAEMALQYSQQLGRNVRRSREAARQAGLWAGSEAPYGYRIVGQGRTRHLEPVPAEAAVIRELAQGVDAGMPYGTLAQQLNARGVPSPRGSTWAALTVKRVLWNPAVAGYHARNRVDMVRDGGGKPVLSHEPILDADVWERLRKKIDIKAQKPGRPSKYLLSGILRCPCGAKMAGRAKAYRYACKGNRAPGTEHVAIKIDLADKVVTDMVLGRIIWLGTLDPDNPTFKAVTEAWGALQGAPEDQGERSIREDAVDAAKSRIQRTARMVAEGHLDEALAGPLLAEYRQELTAAEARLAELGPVTVDVDELLNTTPTRFAALPLARKRIVLKSVLTAVDLLPGNRPAASRLRPCWVE